MSAKLLLYVLGLKEGDTEKRFWAVSQAAPMRRVNIKGGNFTLQDYYTWFTVCEWWLHALFHSGKNG